MRLSPLLLRTVRWPMEAAFVAMGIAVVAQGRVVGAPLWQFDLRLRVATALIAMGVGSVVHDDAVRALESAPSYRHVAVVGRLAAAVLAAGVGWSAVVALAPGPVADLPVGALAIEGCGWLAGVMSISLLLGPSAVASGGLVALVVVQFMPQRWTLTSTPTSPEWHATQVRWAAVAVAGAAVTAWALRDPAARVNRRGRRTRQ